jgi:4-amino-4-deoxy-L-arabinose transferase-like glycosyltransferase
MRVSPWLFLASTLLLGLSVVWVRPGPTLLIGGDAGCYARVGRELAERDLSDWLELTLAHEPFLEHPPLALWLHGLVVRWFGVSPAALVALTRLYASSTLLVLAAVAMRLVARRGAAVEGPTLGGFAVLGALTLPGFLYESQVAMLEAPLALALAVGLFAITGMMKSVTPLAERSVLPSVAWFALALLAGFWVKGPPVLVLVGVVLVVLAFRWMRPLVAGAAIAAGLGVVAVSVIVFDALRARHGLGPFFSTYLSKQVLVSVTEGRHHPESNPFFYLWPTLSWYGPAVGALVLAGIALRFRSRLSRLSIEAMVLGAALWLGIVVGFSIPVQKYQWYVHPGLVGAALLVGSVLALVPEKLDRFIALACVVVALGWPLITLVPWESRLSETQRQIAALQSATGPRRGDAIADCSSMDWWVSGHLMGFLWDARRVECTDPAAWRFDGQRVAAP